MRIFPIAIAGLLGAIFGLLCILALTIAFTFGLLHGGPVAQGSFVNQVPWPLTTPIFQLSVVAASAVIFGMGAWGLQRRRIGRSEGQRSTPEDSD